VSFSFVCLFVSLSFGSISYTDSSLLDVGCSHVVVLSYHGVALASL